MQSFSDRRDRGQPLWLANMATLASVSERRQVRQRPEAQPRDFLVD